MTPPAYVVMVEREAHRHHVPASLIAAMIERESHWDAYARGAAGEWGLMQVKPSVAREMCDWEPRLLHWAQPNVSCGARILRKHFKRCGSWVAAASRFNGTHGCTATAYGIEVTKGLNL